MTRMIKTESIRGETLGSRGGDIMMGDVNCNVILNGGCPLSAGGEKGVSWRRGGMVNGRGEKIEAGGIN